MATKKFLDYDGLSAVAEIVNGKMKNDGTNSTNHVQFLQNNQALTVGRRWEGKNIGGYSVTFGYGCEASGRYSHATGLGAIARGDYSHAEGDGATASGDYSHAEGINTTASGKYSYAVGQNSIASGWYSHAEGAATEASGNGAFASGQYTQAGYDVQFACGRFNDNKVNTLFEVGNGTSNPLSPSGANRSNAFEVYANGDINCTGDIKKNGVNALDEWTSVVVASTSGSDIVAIFDNLSNSYGYKLYCEDTLVGIKSMTKTTGTTSDTIKLTFVLDGATAGITQCKLRIMK